MARPSITAPITMAKASSMVESARPSSSKTAEAVKTVMRTRAAELNSRGEGILVLTAQSRAGAREKAGRQQADEQKDQGHQQARQKNEETGHVFLHAQDAKRAHAHENETEPGGPEGKAADQFRRRGQSSLVEQLGGSRALRRVCRI